MLSYPEKLAALAMIYNRNEREQGEAYAKRELRQMLNDLSNSLLQEMQTKRDGMAGLLDMCHQAWEGKRND